MFTGMGERLGQVHCITRRVRWRKMLWVLPIGKTWNYIPHSNSGNFWVPPRIHTYLILLRSSFKAASPEQNDQWNKPGKAYLSELYGSNTKDGEALLFCGTADMEMEWWSDENGWRFTRSMYCSPGSYRRLLSHSVWNWTGAGAVTVCCSWK